MNSHRLEVSLTHEGHPEDTFKATVGVTVKTVIAGGVILAYYEPHQQAKVIVNCKSLKKFSITRRQLSTPATTSHLHFSLSKSEVSDYETPYGRLTLTTKLETSSGSFDYHTPGPFLTARYRLFSQEELLGIYTLRLLFKD